MKFSAHSFKGTVIPGGDDVRGHGRPAEFRSGRRPGALEQLGNQNALVGNEGMKHSTVVIPKRDR